MGYLKRPPRGFLHLKSTAGCQISTLIFEKKIMEGALYKYPIKNILRTTKFLKSVKGPGNTFDLIPKWSRTLLSLIYFSWDIYRDTPP
jgi:hypothetical protein